MFFIFGSNSWGLAFIGIRLAKAKTDSVVQERPSSILVPFSFGGTTANSLTLPG